MAFKVLTLAVLFGATGAYAFPPGQNGPSPHQDPVGHEFKAAGPFDSRSPCPGLNALANHNWLPRSGKDISYDVLKNAAKQAYNFEEEAYRMVFDLATKTLNLSTTGNPDTLNLKDLNRHNAIEFDGSLSRNDIYLGDDTHYDATVFTPVAEDLGLKDYSQGDHVTIPVAGKAREARQVAARNANPTFDSQDGGSMATTALFLGTLWDYKAKAAPKAWVLAFFYEDRIPYREGYTAPQVKTPDFVNGIGQQLDEAAGQKDLASVIDHGM